MTFFRHITYITFVLFLMGGSDTAHGAQPELKYNKVKFLYNHSLSTMLPISITYRTHVLDHKTQLYQEKSITKLRHNSEIIKCSMIPQSDKKYSRFFVTIPFSQEKTKEFFAHHGDRYLFTYTPNQKGCYISIYKENPHEKNSIAKVDTFTLLLTGK